MKKCKLSIILPVYNSELYLEDCIDSILSQTYLDFELIIINDGSTDNSKLICEKYRDKDDRIVLINKENGGVSSARNLGLQIAKGDLVMFIDSDDLFMANTLSTIISNFDNTDLLCFGFNELYLDATKEVLCCHNINNKEDFLNRVILSHEIGGYLWNKVYKRQIIISNSIQFDESIHYCEDLIFVTDYLGYCRNVKYIKKTLYNYRMRRNSVSFNFLSKKNVSILKAYEKLITKYETDLLLNNFLKYSYIVNYYKLKSIIPKTFIENKEILKEERKIINQLNLSNKEKLRFFLTKYLNWLYRVISQCKNKKVKLFE